MTVRKMVGIALLLCTGWASIPGLAEQPVRISEPTKLDLQFMAQQRQLLQDLAAINLGRQFSGDRDRDLDLLQTLLDQQLVRSDQVRELQAMGVIMGDLLAADLDMHWVIYEDREGRSRALRYRDGDNYLFPITMIARRREVGNQTPIVDIYQKAYDIIDASRPPAPFQ
tara:strand:+ start:252 stop:758 length:507 start_codon:yes stop_codon:yes gene_type:complete